MNNKQHGALLMGLGLVLMTLGAAPLILNYCEYGEWDYGFANTTYSTPTLRQFSGLLVVFGVISFVFGLLEYNGIIPIEQGNKCRFYDKCNLKCAESPACTKDGGDYYGPGRPGGCYREIE